MLLTEQHFGSFRHRLRRIHKLDSFSHHFLKQRFEQGIMGASQDESVNVLFNER